MFYFLKWPLIKLALFFYEFILLCTYPYKLYFLLYVILYPHKMYCMCKGPCITAIVYVSCFMTYVVYHVSTPHSLPLTSPCDGIVQCWSRGNHMLLALVQCQNQRALGSSHLYIQVLVNNKWSPCGLPTSHIIAYIPCPPPEREGRWTLEELTPFIIIFFCELSLWLTMFNCATSAEPAQFIRDAV